MFGLLRSCFTVIFSLSHLRLLTNKQTPPPLDLLQLRSGLHGIPKRGIETQLSDILSVSQVFVRANRQEFNK